MKLVHSTPPTDCPEACCYNQEAGHSCRPQRSLQQAHLDSCKNRSGETQAGRHPQPQTHTQNLPQGNAGQVSTPTQATQARQGRTTEPCLQKLGSSIKSPYSVTTPGRQLREPRLTSLQNKRNTPLLEIGVDNLRFFFFFYSPLERVEISIPSTTSCSVFISSSAKLKHNRLWMFR